MADNDLNPPVASGPFSRYLTGQASDSETIQPQPLQRPSGYMGTGGKLAFLGASLLQGLQRGKIASYQRNEQSAADQYAQDAKNVQAVLDRPDIDPKVKAQLQQLLGQEWARKVKQNLKDTQKGQDKDSFASKMGGMLSSVADKLGGPTPGGHTTAGMVKDPVTGQDRPARDMLYELMGKISTNAPEYNLDTRWQKSADAWSAIVEKGTKEGKDFNSPQDVFEYGGKPAVQIFQTMLDANRQKTGDLAATTFKNLKPAEQGIDQRNKIIKGMQPPVADAGPSGPVQGPVPATTQGGKADSSAPQAPVMAFQPYQTNFGMVTKPEQEDALIQNFGKKSEKLRFKKNNPDGTVTFMDVESWPTVGITKNIATGRRVDVSPEAGWKPATAGEKEPVPVKPKMVTIKKQGPGNTVIEESVPSDQPIQYTPYRPPKTTGGGKPTDPILEDIRKQNLQADKDRNADRQAKENKTRLISKIMADIDQQAKDPKIGMTASQLLDQRIEDFGQYYKDFPDFDENYEAVREALTKRKSMAVAADKAAQTAAASKNKAQRSGLIPKDTPQPKASAKKDTGPQQAKTETMDMVRQFAKDNGITVNEALGAAKAQGYKITGN